MKRILTRASCSSCWRSSWGVPARRTLPPTRPGVDVAGRHHLRPLHVEPASRVRVRCGVRMDGHDAVRHAAELRIKNTLEPAPGIATEVPRSRTAGLGGRADLHLHHPRRCDVEDGNRSPPATSPSPIDSCWTTRSPHTTTTFRSIRRSRPRTTPRSSGSEAAEPARSRHPYVSTSCPKHLVALRRQDPKAAKEFENIPAIGAGPFNSSNGRRASTSGWSRTRTTGGGAPQVDEIVFRAVRQPGDDGARAARRRVGHRVQPPSQHRAIARGTVEHQCSTKLLGGDS